MSGSFTFCSVVPIDSPAVTLKRGSMMVVRISSKLSNRYANVDDISSFLGVAGKSLKEFNIAIGTLSETSSAREHQDQLQVIEKDKNGQRYIHIQSLVSVVASLIDCRAATLLFGKLYDAMPSKPSHLKTLLETANLWTHGDADLVKSDHADFNKPLIDVAHPGFVWDLLTKRFERKNVVEKQNLTASLFLLRMAESSKPIEDFQNLHSNILDICMQLEHMGDL